MIHDGLYYKVQHLHVMINTTSNLNLTKVACMAKTAGLVELKLFVSGKIYSINAP